MAIATRKAHLCGKPVLYHVLLGVQTSVMHASGTRPTWPLTTLTLNFTASKLCIADFPDMPGDDLLPGPRVNYNYIYPR